MKAAPLSERRALITGASAGIGEALAREFARNGFNLVLVARRADKLESLAREIESQHGVEVRMHACDLLDPGAPLGLFQSCRGLEIDVLINNAGVVYHGDFVDQQPSSIDSIVHLNIAALSQLCRLFLKPMLERGRGRIMNVTSTSAFHPYPTMAVYAASKAYILSFSEAIALEVAGTGVAVTAFCPGGTDTQMALDSFGEDVVHGSWTSGLMMMSPEECARHGYRACMSGRVIQVPGVVNQIFNTIGRMQPRWMYRRTQALFTDLMEREDK